MPYKCTSGIVVVVVVVVVCFAPSPFAEFFLEPIGV
jgi:hypothetical protein